MDNFSLVRGTFSNHHKKLHFIAGSEGFLESPFSNGGVKIPCVSPGPLRNVNSPQREGDTGSEHVQEENLQCKQTFACMGWLRLRQ